MVVVVVVEEEEDTRESTHNTPHTTHNKRARARGRGAEEQRSRGAEKQGCRGAEGRRGGPTLLNGVDIVFAEAPFAELGAEGGFADGGKSHYGNTTPLRGRHN